MLPTPPGDSYLKEGRDARHVAPSGPQQLINHRSLKDEHAHTVYLYLFTNLQNLSRRLRHHFTRRSSQASGDPDGGRG